MEITLQHIDKRFGKVYANADINLTFQGGRIYGVLGENGAGKSTLMKILAGFQPADQGEIIVDGKPRDARQHFGPTESIRSGIGMLQQDPLDVASFTVMEDFVYGGGSGLTMGLREAKKALKTQCERFGFELDKDMPVSQLTIGQRQQLEIIRLLALGVRTLILDEPTTGISAEQKETLFSTLSFLAHQQGMTILLVSHKLEDVVALCDQVVVLRAGRLVGERNMPATTSELVKMMFAEELAPQTREVIPLGEVRVVLEDVTMRGRRVTVEGLNLSLRAGEVVGLAGLDGSGQELVLRAAAGVLKTAHGSVTVGNWNLTGMPYRRFLQSGVAFAAAGRLEEGLIAGLTLTEHVALGTSGALINWRSSETDTQERLKQFNVRGRPDSQIQQLSGGNQQRFLMAMMPPKLALLAVEQPTRGLDVDSARWVWTQILARRAEGTAVLFSSPDLDEIIQYSDRVLVFFAGQFTELSDLSGVTIDELGHLIGGQFEGAPDA
ncbi:MAG: ATP-binding cassette domain-containing protein [Anaerolineae bacterium]